MTQCNINGWQFKYSIQDANSHISTTDMHKYYNVVYF